MKKSLLILLLLIPFVGFSQNLKPINQVWGLKFGASKSATLAAIKAKGGTLDIITKTGIYIFKNIKFAGRKPLSMAAFFFQNKFYSASFLFKADDDPGTIDYYNDLVINIDSTYGPGQVTKNFTSGFADGDGNEIVAIQGGYADYQTLWHDDNNNYIIVTIDKNLMVELSYVDAAIEQLYAARQKALEKSDY